LGGKKTWRENYKRNKQENAKSNIFEPLTIKNELKAAELEFKSILFLNVSSPKESILVMNHIHFS
jgi:hypothetical protein